VVAKVTLGSREVRVVAIAPDGAVKTLLSSAQGDLAGGVLSWRTFGLPAVDTSGTRFAVVAKLGEPLPGTADDTALLFFENGTTWEPLAWNNSFGIPPSGPFADSFSDPVVNDQGEVAFVATLRGSGVTTANNAALFHGPRNGIQPIARLGEPASDDGGSPTTALWRKFTSWALSDGTRGSVILLAETSGGDTTAHNKLGLWASDSEGQLRRLLRTGEALTTDGPVLTSLTLLNALPGSYGATRSYNATGTVAVLATFADKSQKLLRVRTP
jgi:hypothetical protein